MPLWTDLLSKIAKGVERAWRATFRIWTEQEYSPRALFRGSECISASTSQGKTMLNGKDVDGVLLGKFFGEMNRRVRYFEC